MIPNKFLDKYYKSQETYKTIAKKLDTTAYFIKKEFKKRNLPGRYDIKDWLNFEEELSERLMGKYSSILTRCTVGLKRPKYTGLEFINKLEYVQFCNKNKKIIENLWKNYLNQNRELKYALSIDRIDTSKGYIISNMQFAPYGFNSWKDNTTPLKCEFKGVDTFALSLKGMSRKVGIPKLEKYGFHYRGRGKNKIPVNIIKVSYEKVLKETNTENLLEYYHKYVE